MLTTPYTSKLRPMDAVRSALDALRIATTARYQLMRGLQTISIELQNVVTEIELSGLRLPDSELCMLLAAGIEAAQADGLAESEHGQYIIEMGRIALERAEEAGLYVRMPESEDTSC